MTPHPQSPGPRRARVLRARRRPLWLALWRVWRWPAFAAAIAGTVALGWLGFRQYFAAIGEPRSGFDLVYLSLQLFTLESGSQATGEHVGWMLQTARFLAPFLIAYAAVEAVLAGFRDEIISFQLRLTRGHDVVCGLGDKGLHLAEGLRARGHRVVAVDPIAGTETAAPCREARVPLIVGNALDPAVLARAGIRRARRVFALSGSDAVNAEIAARVRGGAGSRVGLPLTVFVHLTDAELCQRLRAQELSSPVPTAVSLEFFSVLEAGARLLLDRVPSLADGAVGPPPALIIVGTGALARNLIAGAVQRWRALQEGRGPMAVLLAGPGAGGVLTALDRRFEGLRNLADLTAVEIQPGSINVKDLVFPRGDCPDQQVFVCTGQDDLSLALGLRLGGQTRRRTTVCVERAGGVEALLGPATELEIFVLRDETCSPDLLLGGLQEKLARLYHQDYLEHGRRSGQNRLDNPSLVPWDELPETLRESNRALAAHLALKLRAIDYRVQPWAGEESLFTFTPGEVEQLAVFEHERWVSERKQAGWRPGPKDPERKRTPYLVPYDSLSEEIRELDRNVVRNIPFLLFRAGFVIGREDRRR